MGPAEPLSARPRTDGDGTAQITGPASVPAHGSATWQVTYTCGKSGLPVGGQIRLRRWPLSFEWSGAQSSSPQKAGYVTARGPGNARFQIVPSNLADVRVRLLWPALQPGDKVEIVIGDTSAGGPGMRVQGKTGKLRWIAESDCTTDGKPADLAQTPGGEFEVVPGPPHHVAVVAPATAEVGKPTKLSFEMRDDADNVCTQFTGDFVVSSSLPIRDLPKQAAFRAGEPARLAADVTFTEPGFCAITAKPNGNIAANKTQVTVSASSPLPTDFRASDGHAHAYLAGATAVIANASVRMAFPRNPFGYGYATVSTVGGAGGPLAIVPSFGSIVWPGAASGQPHGLFAEKASASEKGDEATLTFEGWATTPSGKRWPLTVRFRLRTDQQHVQCDYELQPTSTDPILAFYGPTLCTGDWAYGAEKSGALFPGSEYLTADEVSSDDKGVAWECRERWVPHPYKITVPLMAVAAHGATVGLMWDPLQRWDGTHQIPLARFAAPDRPGCRSNNLMSLFVPDLSTDFKENQTAAAKPWTPLAGGKLQLSADVFALGDLQDVTGAVSYWAKTHALPEAKPPRSWPDEMALCANGTLTTGWDAKAKGWISAIGLKPAPDTGTADRLTMEALLSGDADLTRRAGEQVSAALSPGAAGTEYSLRQANAPAAVMGLQGALPLTTSRHAEVYWTFADCYDTHGDRATLAGPDDVELGTCVNNLWSVFRYALATGDPRAVDTGLRGLDYIRRFHKPAGAESWEVPLTCPNLRAAALALDCNLAAYKLTGRSEYLDGARYWAWSGLSFIYLWQAPDRPIMQGSSISVLGTTFYNWGWFGNAVQWVGLVYAESLERLAAVDTSYKWDDVARLIVASAMQQQKTADAPCKHLGFFPDSYSPVLGHDTYEWCLVPNGIAGDVMGLLGLPPIADSAIARTATGTIHVTSVARVSAVSFDPAASTLKSSLHYVAGQSCGAVVFGLTKPAQITWQGRSLPAAADLTKAPEGWSFDEQRHFIGLKLNWQGADGDLVVEGASQMPYRAPSLPAQVPNAGFEEGLLHWTAEPGASIDATRPHTGKAALQLLSPDQGHEVQATSEAVQVEAGRQYRLSAWVWEVEGDGNYKTTIDWRDVTGGHIAYDNDWQGNNKPAQYTEHGGIFTAPAGAASAVIILGGRGGTFLFDDVTLTPVER
jgi:hypothetical protein